MLRESDQALPGKYPQCVLRNITETASGTAKRCSTARHGVLRGHREWALTVAQEDGGKHSELTLTYVGH